MMYVGVSEEERLSLQPVETSLNISYLQDFKSISNTDIERTVCYHFCANIIKALSYEKWILLENIAHHVIQSIIEKYHFDGMKIIISLTKKNLVMHNAKSSILIEYGI